MIDIPKSSGGGGNGGRSGGGGDSAAQLEVAIAEKSAIGKELDKHNSTTGPSPGKFDSDEVAAQKTQLRKEWLRHGDELNAKYKVAKEKVESLKSAAQKATEKAAGDVAVKKMQEREYKEARDKVMQTGIYKPKPARKQTVAEKRRQWEMDHPL